MLCIDCILRDKEFMEVFIKDLKVEKVFCAVFIVKFPLLNPGSHLISTIELYVAYQICTFVACCAALLQRHRVGGRGLLVSGTATPGLFLSCCSVFLIAERLGFCSVSESWEGLKIGADTWNLTWLMITSEWPPKYSLFSTLKPIKHIWKLFLGK